MSDRNAPPGDADDEPTTVSRWPLFGRGRATPPPPPPTSDEADETTTRWVPSADRTTLETPQPAASTPSDGGWFSADATTQPSPDAVDAAELDQPQWAAWDDPWPAPDEPFDQAALPETPADGPAGHAPSQGFGTGDHPTGAAGGGSDPTPLSPPSAGASPATGSTTSSPSTLTEPTGGGHTGGDATGGDPIGGGHTAAAGTSWANLHAIRVIAQVACPLLLLIGLSVGEDGRDAGWSAYTAWAIFAMICALLQLAPLAGRSLGLTTENAWFLAAVGTAGLVGYWVIIVLPGASSNVGFAQTLATGLAVVGLWLSPGRRV